MILTSLVGMAAGTAPQDALNLGRRSGTGPAARRTCSLISSMTADHAKFQAAAGRRHWGCGCPDASGSTVQPPMSATMTDGSSSSSVWVSTGGIALGEQLSPHGWSLAYSAPLIAEQAQGCRPVCRYSRKRLPCPVRSWSGAGRRSARWSYGAAPHSGIPVPLRPPPGSSR